MYEIDSLSLLRFLVTLQQVNKVSFFEGGRDVHVCTNVVVNILSNQSHHTDTLKLDMILLSLGPSPPC